MSQRLKRWESPRREGETKEEADLQDRDNSKNKRRCCGKGKEGGEKVRAVAVVTKTTKTGGKVILPLILFCDHHAVLYQ